MRFPTELVAELDLDMPGIHVLRGPRQVGKSTDLKLLIDRALDEGHDARSVIYLTLDLIEDQPHAELAAAIKRAKTLGRSPSVSLILLDEVTAVPRWQTAVKAVWDDGTVRGDVLVCTGSSALDLQQGAAERLPGRRGAGSDHLVLPQTFGSFARSVAGTVPSSPKLTVADLMTTAGRDMLRDAQVHRPALEDALERYLKFGGLPAAVAEAVAGEPEPTDRSKRVLHDSLLREVQRKGASVPAANALLERVARSLGSKTNWSTMAREMDVPLGSRRAAQTSHHTLRSYIELLAGGYFLFIVYFLRADRATNNLTNDKKVFFADPLLHTIALDHVPGVAPDIPALIENAVGLALYRAYESADRLVETFVAPDNLHIWQTARGGEVDFAAGPGRTLDLVEVKYRSNVKRQAGSATARAQPGRPAVVATRDQLDFHDHYSLVPASTLLWALG